MNPYLGEIRLFSFKLIPKGWFACAGQILPISQYTALFSLLGTYYGGNGTQTFALPDLRSRVPLHMSTTYVIGQAAGVENVTLNLSELPMHQHMLQAVNSPGGANVPTGNLLAQANPRTDPRYASASSGITTLNPASVQSAGGNTQHSNIQPYLALSYCIAYSGIFPSRG